MKRMLLIGLVFLAGCSAYVRQSGYESGFAPISSGYFGQDSFYGLLYYKPPAAGFTESEIATMVDKFLCVTGNPNLQIGEIRARQRGFEIEILTRTGALVDILYADKHTSWIRSIYGGARF